MRIRWKVYYSYLILLTKILFVHFEEQVAFFGWNLAGGCCYVFEVLLSNTMCPDDVKMT